MGVLREVSENVQTQLENLWFVFIFESRREAKLRRCGAAPVRRTVFDAPKQPDAALEPELWPQTPSGADAWPRIAPRPRQGPKTHRLKP